MGQDAYWDNVCKLPGLPLCVQRKSCLYPGVRTFVVKLVHSVSLLADGQVKFLEFFLLKFSLEEYSTVSYNVFIVQIKRMANLEHLVIFKAAFFLQLLLKKVTVF